MIGLFFGIQGSGKSLHAVARCYSYLMQGLTVVTNLPLVVDKFIALLGFDAVASGQLVIVNGEQLKRVWELGLEGESEEHPVKLIWDEASRELDSYFKGADLKQLLDWFKEHRHYKYDVELITPNLSLLQARVRATCADMIVHDSGRSIRIRGLGCRLPPPWRYMLSVQRWDRAGKFALDTRQWHFIDKRFTECYVTHSKDGGFGAVGRVCSRVVQKGVHMSKRWKVFVLLQAGILSLSMLILAIRGRSDVVCRHDSQSMPAAKGQAAPAAGGSIVTEDSFVGVAMVKGNLLACSSSGQMYSQGQPSPWGIISGVSHFGVFVKDKDGQRLLIPR